MKVKIKRQDGPKEPLYYQTFNYQSDKKETVAAILDNLNYTDDLYDEDGNPARRIRWECSCMQKMCGACAMVINHVPSLACSTFIDTKKEKELIIEPLSKFPVITDLCVDRSCITEHLTQARLYVGSLDTPSKKEAKIQYMVAKCLKCGLCLEVCPNYIGEEESFYGAIMANESYLMHSLSADRKSEIKGEYERHFAGGCSKSLACRDICPMHIPTLSSIGYMNR